MNKDTKFLFGTPGDFASRNQGLMLVGLVACISLVALIEKLA